VRNLTTAKGEAVFADDHEDTNGDNVLSFGQAQDAARSDKNEAKRSGPYTVTTALAGCLNFSESEGRSAHSLLDTRCRIDALILP
jgi:hypothetical protein